jgi:large subunit ribosomal protein L6
MSKIGQKTIEIPSTVNVTITKDNVGVKGPEGELSYRIPVGLKVNKEDAKMTVTRTNEQKRTKSAHGLFRQLIHNAIVGVEKPWVKRLEIVGTGFNVKMQGEDLVMRLGFSHLVVFKKVPGVKYQVENNTKIVVTGADKQLVGQVAFQIKLSRKPDAYKGKGIRYEGERLRIKPGKKAKAAGAPGAA